jgi:hypothetical protein
MLMVQVLSALILFLAEEDDVSGALTFGARFVRGLGVLPIFRCSLGGCA